MKISILFVSIIIIYCSCFHDKTPARKFVYQSLMGKEFIYTIETDFDNHFSLNIYAKPNKKLFEKEFRHIFYIDSVINNVIYLSKYVVTGTPEKNIKSLLTKLDSGSLGYQGYSYKIKYFTDNFAGIDRKHNWKILKFETDKLVFQDCKSLLEFSIPINNIINDGGELRVKKNINQGLAFSRILDCKNIGYRRLDFFDSVIFNRFK